MRRRNKQSFRLGFCLTFSGISFLVFGGLLVSAFFANFIVSWNRFLFWTTIFSIILITLFSYSLLSNSKYNKNPIKSIIKLVPTVIVCVFLISLTFLSMFTFYNSPLIGDANLQVTKMDWEGVEWIMDFKNKQIVVEELGITHYRYASAIYGKEEYYLIEPGDEIYKPIPDHFSYHNITSLGKYYNESRYMIITRSAKIRYPEAYPNYKELWRFTPSDFDQLQDDNSVNRVFHNGDFEAYLIRPNTI